MNLHLHNSIVCVSTRRETPRRRWRDAGRYALTGLLLVAAAAGQAGEITVTVAPGDYARVVTHTDGVVGNNPVIKLVDGANGDAKDGQLVFTVGGKSFEENLDHVWVEKIRNQTQRQFLEIKFTPNGTNLASLEPFELPSFMASTSLYAIIDIEGLLNAGSPYTAGQMIDVVNGINSASPYVVFKDGSSLPADFDFNQFSSDSLANYTGSVTVFSIDQVAPIPEPATATLVAASLLGLAASRRREKPACVSEN